MSLDEIIKEAIKPLVPVCVIDVYLSLIHI